MKEVKLNQGKLKRGLVSLGIKGQIQAIKYDSFSYLVYVSNQYFGLWDNVKGTFVS